MQYWHILIHQFVYTYEFYTYVNIYRYICIYVCINVFMYVYIFSYSTERTSTTCRKMTITGGLIFDELNPVQKEKYHTFSLTCRS